MRLVAPQALELQLGGENTIEMRTMMYPIDDPEEARLQEAYDEARARVEKWITGERRLLLQGTSVEHLSVEGLMEFMAADEDKPRDFADADKAFTQLRTYRAARKE